MSEMVSKQVLRQSKYKIQLAQIPIVFAPIALLPTVQPTLMITWKIPFDQ